MLVLPNDSGYNSPCDGVFPSSFALPSPCKLLTDINPKIYRKLDFGTRSSSSDPECDITSADCNGRSQEIANRLMLMCDLFDNEFAQFPQQGISWTSAILRFFGY